MTGRTPHAATDTRRSALVVSAFNRFGNPQNDGKRPRLSHCDLKVDGVNEEWNRCVTSTFEVKWPTTECQQFRPLVLWLIKEERVISLTFFLTKAHAKGHLWQVLFPNRTFIRSEGLVYQHSFYFRTYTNFDIHYHQLTESLCLGGYYCLFTIIVC